MILKGGSDAIHSNIAIVKVLQDALEACSMPRTAVQLIEDTDRAVTAQFMKMKEYVDVLIPRGGAGLIRSVVENSTIPVIAVSYTHLRRLPGPPAVWTGPDW